MSKLNNANEGEYIEKQLEKTLYILFRGRFSNRKSNTLHNKLILKANCQLFFLTQFVRLHLVLPCTLSLTVFVWLYFVLQPQVFQLVPWQPLTQVVRLFFTIQLPVIQPLFSLLLFHSPSLSFSSRIFGSSFS